MSRMKLIKSSKYFITCKCCGFEYMPFTKASEDNCPKCTPKAEKYVDVDAEYIGETNEESFLQAM